jgi:enoyl-CoA hydratase/carnithine racemase
MPIDTELRIENRGPVRWLILDRPASKNGLTLDVVDALTSALTAAGADPAVRVVVLGGAGGSFCSGLDLKAALASTSGIDLGGGLARFHGLVRALRGLLKPTIAAVDGAAAGFGCDLALACDLRLASPRGRLGERFVRIGLMADGGGTFWLPRLVGTARAFELLYEGRMVEADEALAIGLVNHLLPADSFEAAVDARAAVIAAGPPLAFARTKAAILRASDEAFETALAAEREGQLALLQSQDFTEGVQAFFMRRDPVFQGK